MPTVLRTMKAESAATGLRSILIATAVAGLLGYGIQLLAPALLPDGQAYVTFSMYWSTLYLCVAALSGVQQEVTRAAHPSTASATAPTIRSFALIIIAVVLAAVTAVAVSAGPVVFRGPTVALAVALGAGLVGYVLIAVLGGVLYGLHLWNAVAALTIIDVGIRAVLVLTAFLAGWSPEAVAFAVSLPFGLAFLLVWLWTRRRVVGAFRLDVRLGRLLANAAGTVTAAAAMGVMMNGMPLLLGVAAGDADEVVLAGLILTITLTRAPLVVPLLALQSFLISLFRGAGRAVTRRVLSALALAAVAVALLAGAAWLIGPWVIQSISRGQYEITPAMMATITASAGLVGMMCVTGPALVGRNRHVPYTAGWVIAAVLTVLALAAPLPFDARLTLALLAPPAIGLLVHVVAVWRHPEVDPAPLTAGGGSGR
ncbi:hypothetical protein [Microbacterium sp. CPCC 204701]|uniref:hypothetical protein n=1 Tax=Microbacterium sp. CPCC 204701 TaxID=2493084 RepID=UPI00197B5900|nr:hypothetical protein [Microbacterium sp. CPCC 204701]